jgi:cytochrome c6
MDTKRKWTKIAAPSLICFAGLILFVLPACAQTGGAALYKAKCATCHGAAGKGDTALGKMDKIRDLGSADVQQQSDAALSAIISNGKDKMPAYGKSLKPDQVKDLVTYIRSLATK